MDISNKTLGLLLVAAIVVSVGGTLISLNKLESVSPTGFAASDTGTVSLDILESIEIIVDPDTIDFGTCTLNTSRASEFNSSGGPTFGDNEHCVGGSVASFPDNITIRNAGNLDAELVLNASVAGGVASGQALFTATGSSWDYYLTPGSGTPCVSAFAGNSWTNIAYGAANTADMSLCGNFTTNAGNGGTDPVLYFFFAATVGQGASNTNNLDLVFEGVGI